MSAQARPVALTVNLDAIPDQLRQRPQWVGWRYSYRAARHLWTKVPVNVLTGGNASTIDVATWATFDETVARYEQHDLDGIGYVFSADDPYAGIDLDHCRDATTGDLADWAQDIVDQIDTYTEVSPSGAGVKLFFQATLPDGQRQHKRDGVSIECYHEGRFFTVTGHALCGHQPEPRQRIIDAWYARTFVKPETPPARPEPVSAGLDDQAIIERAQRAANGAKFSALWSGDVGGYPSASEADLALCSMLAFWCGPDSARVDRLFRMSGLYRDKWKRKDYREDTLTKALSRAQYYDPGRPDAGFTFTGAVAPPEPPRSLDDFSDGITLADLQYKQFQPLRWIVADLLPEGAALLAGKAKAKKSWLGLATSLAVAMNVKALGSLTTDPGTVLYLDLEGNQRRIKDRTTAMLGVQSIDWPATFTVFTEWPTGEAGLIKLRLWFNAHPDTRLVVIDVFQDFRGATDPRANPYEADRAISKALNQLAEEFHCAILLIHHTRKMKAEDVFDEISGTTGLQSGVATMWVLSRMPDGVHTQLSLRGRDLRSDDALALSWSDYHCRHVIEGRAEDFNMSLERQAVLEVLNDDVSRTPREIAELLGKTASAVGMLLHSMVRDGLVDKVGYGKYAIIHKRGT